MTLSSRFLSCIGLVLAIACFSAIRCSAQTPNPALDSMGANMGRQNWKAAIHWALKAAEANPAEKYWRYLNAAGFASQDRNADLALQYAALVIDSDIAIKAAFGPSFDWLRDDPRWKQLMAKVASLKERDCQERIKANVPFRHYQQELLAQTDQYVASLTATASPNELYRQIRQNRPAHRYTRTGQYQNAWLKLTDSLEFPYLVQLPANFDPRKPYPLVVVLHGAVSRQTQVPDAADSTTTPAFHGRLFTELARQSGVIAVFPYSTRQYNWMMPDDGFDLVPRLVQEVKHQYSIDDSRVYVTGHSNGATGAFSYWMKQPTLFAGFSGINNRPQVRTGGTFLKNGLNRSFYNVATDFDYYFPVEGHRSFSQLAQKLGVDWKNQEIAGHRSHGYLISAKDSLARTVYQHLFADMLARQRNPFQNRLYWECDDVKHGRCDWLEISQLDTLASRANWHTTSNFPVVGWRSVTDPAVLIDSTSQAFTFPRHSGAIQATYSNNQFELKTSRVGVVTIYLSPEMVNFSKSLKVIVNGKILYDGPITMDRDFLVSQYRREMDHQAVWANRLRLTIR